MFKKIMTILLGVMVVLACNSTKTITPMDHSTYDQLWTSIEANLKEGRYKDARDLLDQVELKAKDDQNDVQLIKVAYVYSQIQHQIEEDSQFLAIKKLESFIPAMNTVGQAVARSYLGGLYYTYYRENLYKIQNLTETEDIPSQDIATWTKRTFEDKIQELYLSSIIDDSKNVSIEDYEPIITIEKNAKKQLRPTVYDLLAHRAINYFMLNPTYVSTPKDDFIMDDTDLFAPSRSFIDLNLNDENANSLSYTLQVFQKLERFRMDNTTLKLDVILKRLKFVHQNITYARKDDLYIEALEREIEQNNDVAGVEYLLESLANQYLNQSYKYNQGENPEYKNYKKQAISVFEQAIKVSEDTKFNEVIKSRIKNIQLPTIHIRTNEVIPIQQAAKFRIDYTNTTKVKVIILKITQENYVKMHQDYNFRLENIDKNSKEINFYTTDLPQFDNDYQQHSVELSLPPLENGIYALKISNLSSKEEQLALFQVSDIGVVKSDDLHIINRNDGKGILNAIVQIYEMKYKGRNQRNYELFKTLTTNIHGRCNINKSKGEGGQLIIKTKNDRLILFQRLPRDYSYPENNNNMNIFTDRNIYRPGQEIYFKAILYQTKLRNNFQVLPNKSVEVILKDANYQEISKIKLKTNEYGSIHDKFKLPETGLTGMYRIQINHDDETYNYNVQVVEYKRPKFEVLTDTITQALSLNQEVRVKGRGKSFAGFGIDGAKVSYEVTRKEPYYFYRYWSYYQPSPTTIISHGTTTTDKNGEFQFSFIAESDKSIANGDKRNYIYEVIVYMTDINGETQSSATNIRVNAWSSYIKVPNEIIIDQSADKLSLPFQILNSNEQPIDQDVSYIIESIDTPKKLKVDNSWAIPQTQIIDQDTFYKKFPHSYYSKKESEINTLDIIYQGKISKPELNLSDLSPGQYRITLETDGAPKTYTTITVVDRENREIPKAFTWNFDIEKLIFQPGEKANIAITTPLNNLQVHYIITRMGNKKEHGIIEVDKVGSLEIPILETDRGGIRIQLFTGVYNKILIENFSFQVPYDNLDLDITWKSIRKNLLPGSKETWSIVIKDKDNHPVQVEILSSMYDLSLDQFSNHEWQKFYFPQLTSYVNINELSYGTTSGRRITEGNNGRILNLPIIKYPHFVFDILNYNNLVINVRGSRGNATRHLTDAIMMKSEESNSLSEPPKIDEVPEDEMMNIESDHVVTNDVDFVEKEILNNNANKYPIRRNLNETVFFMPTLRTNDKGETILEFTMNEALTSWKLQTFGHTKDLKFGYDQQIITTKKDLMVVPNGPRFFREGDKMILPAKISNLSDKNLAGEVSLKIIDANSQKDISKSYNIGSGTQPFSIKKGESTQIFWEIDIPKNESNTISYQVLAKGNRHVDGEENTILVLPNRTLVTESIPLTIQANATKTFHISSLDKLGSTNTLDPQLYSLSFTSNPTWLAVQALPYLMEYPYESSENLFARFFANQLGHHIIELNPKIESIYKKWEEDKDLVSLLNQNEDLKSAINSETPWVQDALSEEEQMLRMAKLFDKESLEIDSKQILNKLKTIQNGGGFPWYQGGRPNWYITQYILEGFGQLDKLDVIDLKSNDYNSIIEPAIRFIDDAFIDYHNEYSKSLMKPIVVHFLYVRSFYPHIKNNEVSKLINTYLTSAEKNWLDYSLVNQSRLAISYHRNENSVMAQKIIESLRQRSIISEDLGMYWKQTNGYHWYQSGIENQASIVNAFHEIDPRREEIDKMKIWLLRNKQTNRWKSTKATTQAVYALVEKGTSWIVDDTKVIEAQLGDKTVVFDDKDGTAGIGFIKKQYLREDIKPEMSVVVATNKNNHMAWGSVSFQYWEDSDKIESYQETPLELTREFYKKVMTDQGHKLIRISEGQPLRVGDILTIKMQLNVDRPMEFIHLKDNRPSNVEPVQVLSRYFYKSGLGYYMETRDIATNFFIDFLPRGKYTLEYDVRVAQAGDFSVGIANVQSMYAPEFGAHSKGSRIIAKQK